MTTSMKTTTIISMTKLRLRARRLAVALEMTTAMEQGQEEAASTVPLARGRAHHTCCGPRR